MKWTNPKVIISVIILCIGVALATGYGVMNFQNEAVASINGENITKDQLYEEMVKSSGQEVLNNLISANVIKLEMQKQNIVISEEEIQNELNQFYEYYGGEEAFTETLTATGFTIEDIKGDIITNLGVKKLLEPQISITEEEMKSYFDENKAILAEEGQEANYEKSKDEIKKILLQQKSETEYAGWMEALQQQYAVVNHLSK